MSCIYRSFNYGNLDATVLGVLRELFHYWSWPPPFSLFLLFGTAGISVLSFLDWHMNLNLFPALSALLYSPEYSFSNSISSVFHGYNTLIFSLSILMIDFLKKLFFSQHYLFSPICFFLFVLAAFMLEAFLRCVVSLGFRLIYKGGGLKRWMEALSVWVGPVDCECHCRWFIWDFRWEISIVDVLFIPLGTERFPRENSSNFLSGCRHSGGFREG